MNLGTGRKKTSVALSELGDSEDRETGKDQNPCVNSSQVHCSLESLAGRYDLHRWLGLTLEIMSQ